MSLSPPKSLIESIFTMVRRIVKIPSSDIVSNEIIGEYLNRFYQEVPERLQLFELTRDYIFETEKFVNQYKVPVDVYGNFLHQNFSAPCYIDGLNIEFFQDKQQFYCRFPTQTRHTENLIGDGSVGPYEKTTESSPITRGFTDHLNHLEPAIFITATENDGTQMYVVDNGAGKLLQTDGTFQFGPEGEPQTPIYLSSSSVNYGTGQIQGIIFSEPVPSNARIHTQTIPFRASRPWSILFYNNIFTLYPVPDRAYKINIKAHISPMSFINLSESLAFSYMAEYLARGTARKILSDNGDIEQFQFYEPLFKESETLVSRRSNRQNSKLPARTIYNSNYLY